MFDEAEARTDFARIAAAGFDSTRIFLTWEDFQPTPDTVSTEMLERLVLVADLATEAGLGLMPTLFTGHMSGANWIPGWALDPSHTSPRFRVISSGSASRCGLRNWFTDPDIGAAQALLAGEIARALAGHPGLWAWDLGNENSNCVVPADKASGSAWLERITTTIRDADESTAITIGLHMEDLEEDRNIGPAEAASVCDFLTMHGYPIYAPWAAGPTDEHLLGFLTEVTGWLGGGADVLFSEFGLPTSTGTGNEPEATASMLVDEAAAASYTERAMKDLHRAGATGAMLWCANDYRPLIWSDPPLDEAPHERSFGLWRSDGSPKPAVAAAGTSRGLTVSEPADDRPWIDINPSEFYTDGGSHLARLYRRYRHLLVSTQPDDRADLRS